MDQLRIAYNERHAPAVAVFEHFVKPGRLSSFRADWDRYRYGEREDKAPASPENTELSHEDLIMLCYCGSGDSWETHINMSASKKAAQRIRRLMSYASET
nr:hypothetical protein [uncultured Undibacterium sp.]